MGPARRVQCTRHAATGGGARGLGHLGLLGTSDDSDGFSGRVMTGYDG